MPDYVVRMYALQAVGNMHPENRKPRLRTDSAAGEWIFPTCIDGQEFLLGVTSSGRRDRDRTRKVAKRVCKQVAQGDLAETLKQAAQTIGRFEDLLAQQGFSGLKFGLHLPSEGNIDAWTVSILESDGRVKRQYAYTHHAESPLAGLRAIDTIRR